MESFFNSSKNILHTCVSLDSFLGICRSIAAEQGTKKIRTCGTSAFALQHHSRVLKKPLSTELLKWRGEICMFWRQALPFRMMGGGMSWGCCEPLPFLIGSSSHSAVQPLDIYLFLPSTPHCFRCQLAPQSKAALHPADEMLLPWLSLIPVLFCVSADSTGKTQPICTQRCASSVLPKPLGWETNEFEKDRREWAGAWILFEITGAQGIRF